MGKPCPPGHFCREGTVSTEPCQPGYYAREFAMPSCLPCPRGFTCPNTTTVEPTSCSKGHYCPQGSYLEKGDPCPIGTYLPESGGKFKNECRPCLPGKYCDNPGQSEPAGSCLAGYLCRGGAKFKAPNDTNDPQNGPCPIGMYCEEGTTNGTKCPIGTMRPFTGGKNESDCLPCNGGYYCDEPGLAAAKGKCLQGYYCPPEAKIKSPTPSDYLCPRGYFCGNGTAHPYGCEQGKYQPNEIQHTCLPCPKGKYCPANTSVPEPCPPHYYCTEGSIVPEFCPNGTFTRSDETGLTKPEQCRLCINGSYCQMGAIKGPCAAGYLCYIGNPTPTPDGSNEKIGRLCPLGHYCPEGALEPKKCEDGLVITIEGAKSVADCQRCSAGFICTPGNSIPTPCPAGYYCPVNETKQPCPIKTYSLSVQAVDIRTCLPCPAGYWCNVEATANYTTRPCPVGHYCENATTVPTPCPPGTYRDSQGAASESDCHPCPAGYYCPETNGSIWGEACSEGTFCPEGSSAPRECLAGYYCNRSMSQVPCPPGYYCPRNSSQPVRCPVGHYCDPKLNCYNDSNNEAGACTPRLCDPGYQEIEGSNRGSFATTCQICKPGYYNDAANKGDCKKCRGGVICLEGAITDNPSENGTSWGVEVTKSYLCPRGYYCESGDITPRPCRNGTYNAHLNASSPLHCQLCALDHFNHLQAQNACFPCGSSASAKHLGSDTCECNGQHRVFMPSDRRCFCKEGYRTMEGREQDCVSKLYPLCPEGYYRDQLGECKSVAAWNEYCETKECLRGSVGFDKELGLCKCKVDDLEDVCDRECRNNQRNRITIICKDPPYIIVRGPDNVITSTFNVSSLSRVPNFEETFSSDRCPTIDGKEYPINLADVNDDGFTGVYDPDATVLVDLLSNNTKENANISNPETVVTTPSARRRRRSLLALPTASSFKGITSPTTCLAHGSTMIWIVNNENYPIYDADNLYNTNPFFDYGAFRELQERHSQKSTQYTMFAFKFEIPGVYVFKSSNKNERKMYIRVMAMGAQCAEDGPFFSTTPRAVIQNGMAISRDILIMPDWALIGAMLGSFFLLMVILVLGLLVFRKHGWTKVTFKFPRYRVLAQRYNFDDYSSKGSTVHPAKKYHYKTAAVEAISDVPQSNVAEPNTGALAVKSDEFWDYDQQVDMEGFSSTDFYSILAKQSRDVTAAISRQKDQAKQLYQKVNQQTESLKGLWIAKLNLRGRAAMATPEDLRAYEEKKNELEDELERRQDLGFKFQQILRKQKSIWHDDETAREAHRVVFQATLREANRILKAYSENPSRNNGQTMDEFNDQLEHKIGSRVDSLLQRLEVEVTSECQRRGAWALLGEFTGARLCTVEGEILGHDKLFNADGSVSDTDLITTDPRTGLLIPNPETANMLLSDNITNVPVPPYFFLNPQSGQVMPIEGNISYDPLSSRLVITSDSMNADAASSSEALIPFIPYPVNPETGVPVKASFVSVEKRSDMRLNGKMICSKTGLPAPILGMTIHPETSTAYPVGGCHNDPVTGLPVAIEIGGMMLDPNTGLPVPITNVTIDPCTGDVIPLGGTSGDNDRGDEIPILLGDSFMEPLSSRQLKVTSSRLIGDGEELELEPIGGGYELVLDVGELYHEFRVIDTLRALKDAITGPQASSGRHETSLLESAVKDLSRLRGKALTHRLRFLHDVMRREERATLLLENGGSPGMYEFSATGQLLPILVGTTCKDPSGTELDVPILGIEKDRETDSIIPLGGSMEDPTGDGLVPIMIGEKAVDPVTDEMSTICGVRLNKEFGVVEPMTLSSSAQKKRKPTHGAVALLEDELAGRRSFWRRQRHREEEQSAMETSLHQDLMNDEYLTAAKVKERLESIREETTALADAAHREVQRRSDASIDHAAALPADVVAVLTLFDEDERKYEEDHCTAHKKFIEAITRFFDKIQAEEYKYNSRMEELQGALNPEAEAAVTERFVQAKARLRGELQDHLQSRTEQIDESHSLLEYLRHKAEVSALEAKIVLTGGTAMAGDYEVSLLGIYGDDIPLPETNREMIPLLQKLIKLLQEGGYAVPSGVAQILPQAGFTMLDKKEIEAPGFMASPQAQQGIIMGMQQPSALYSVHRGTVAGPSKQTAVTTSVSKDRQSRVEDGPGFSVADIINSVDVTQMGEKYSSESVTVADITSSGTLTEEKRKEIQKNLMEKHTMECAQLENELRSNEIKTITDVITEYEQKKDKALTNLKEELRQKLKSANSEEEKEALLMEYSSKMTQVQDEIEREKQKKLRDVRKKLKAERLKRKKELYSRHKEEARAAGISDVADLELPDDDELERDLILLAQQQEKLIAELTKAYAEESDREREEIESGRRMAFDQEMEARLKGMKLSLSPEDIDEAMEEVKELHTKGSARRTNMKEKMKERKERKRGRKSVVDLEAELKHVEPGSQEEADIKAAIAERENADRIREEQALLSVLDDVETEAETEARQKVVSGVMKKSQLSDREQQLVVERFMAEAEKMNENYKNMQSRSRAVLMAKLAARKRLKEEMSQEKVIKQQLKDMANKQAELKGEEEALEVMQAAETSIEEKVAKNLEELAEKHVERQAALDIENQEKVKAMEEETEEERTANEANINEQIDEQKKKIIQDKKDKFEKDMAREGDKLSQEQADHLLEQHKQELEFLERNLDAEKRRQIEALNSKILEKKRRKAAAMNARHEVEMKKELLDQQAERQQIWNDQARLAQKEALSDKVQTMDSEQAGNTIFQVLQQRHTQEKVEAEERYAREVEIAKAEARAQAEEARQAARDQLIGEQEQEFMELIAKSSSLSSGELAQQKAELKLKHKKQLAEFDGETEELLTTAENEALPSLEVKHAYARLELREKQLAELAGTMKELTTEEELVQSYIEESQRAADAAKEYRERTMFEMANKINEIKEKRRVKSEEERKRMDEEIRMLEEKLDEERNQEELRLAEREAERVAKKLQLAQEQEASRQLSLAQRGLNEEEKEKLLKEHEENMAKFEQNLRKEQDRVKEALREKLEARRKKKRDAAMKDIVDTATKTASEADEQHRKEIQALQKEGAQMMSASTPSRPRTPPSSKEPEKSTSDSGASEEVGRPPADGTVPLAPTTARLGVSEQDLAGMVMGTPLFESLNEIESKLRNNIGEGGVAGAKGGRPYIDVQDAQWLCGGDLVPVDINELSPTNFVVYRFGVFVTDMLKQVMKVPDVTLLLASNLPNNDYQRNAFRNSFFFEHARKILFIRQERMHSVGDFVVVIMHCLAHIKVDDLVDDNNPLFLREFYKAMRICCQDMFFQRSRSTRASSGMPDDSALYGAFKAAFNQPSTVEERMNVVEELVNMKVIGSSATDFSIQGITERLARKNAFLTRANLKEYLSNAHAPSEKKQEYTMKRIGELAGYPLHDQTRSRHQPSRGSAIMSPKQLLSRQITKIERSIDDCNEELTKAMKSEAELNETIQEMEDNTEISTERITDIKEQLRSIEMHKESIIRKLDYLEDEIVKKRKLLN